MAILTDPAQQLQLLVEGVRDYAIVMLDPEGRVTSWNRGAERIKGYAAEEIVGQHFSRFYTEEDLQRGHPGEVLRRAEAVGRYEEEGWRVRRDGSRFWASILVTALFDADSELVGFGKLVRDISDRREVELERERLLAELRQVARIDELTGLLNRRAWLEELRTEIQRAARRGGPPCVAMIDLDGFKAFNDELGHLAGDAMLREAAASWQARLRSNDSIGRFGGDEFGCLLPDCTEADAVEIVERVRLATPGSTTATIGVARLIPGESAEELLERADRALYRAKGRGRDRTCAAGEDG